MHKFPPPSLDLDPLGVCWVFSLTTLFFSKSICHHFLAKLMAKKDIMGIYQNFQ
jgi:hypothetical protein